MNYISPCLLINGKVEDLKKKKTRETKGKNDKI